MITRTSRSCSLDIDLLTMLAAKLEAKLWYPISKSWQRPQIHVDL